MCALTLKTCEEDENGHFSFFFDVTTIPQARLTFEQQVSSDITLTYITNLAVTNQQIVRVEWDLNKKWSVVALRDENGAFGIDFQYKKRIK